MAQLSITRRQSGCAAVLDLSGTFRLGSDGAQLRESTRLLLEAGEKYILINLGGVGYMDSSGLGELVSAYSTAKRQGAVVKLMNLSPQVASILQMTKLVTVFETFADEDRAVSSFETVGAAATAMS